METNFHKGRLNSWNEDKGFGFIETEHGTGKVFIHISALKRMSRRPTVGDVIKYQIHIENDGKSRAVNARIEGVAEIQPITKRKHIKNHNGNKWLSMFFTITLLILMGFVFYHNVIEKNEFLGTTPSPIISFPLKQENKVNYSCNGKVYCSEMTSCEEAEFYQNYCPGTKMDGDGDGIPCERQWCGW